MRHFVYILFWGFMFCFISISLCYAQDQSDSLKTLKNTAPKIYIDCSDCDIDFIKTEITFVNYVRDSKEAQVHILITTQETGGGGIEHTITFIGRQVYSGMEDTLKFFSKQSDSQDDIRRGIVRVLKMDLVRYVAKTSIADQLSISLAQPVEPTAVIDKWKSWVFSISMNGYFNGEKSRNYLSIWGSLSARRVTPDWKINLSLDGSYYENNYEYKIDDTTVSSSSFSRSKSLNGLMVKSIDDHWSAGVSGYVFSSTYSNIKRGFRFAPAIEYDLFPYSESTRRQLRFLYRVHYNFDRYIEETIFNKTSETLFDEALSITLELHQPWGSVNTTLEGSHYLHDFRKNEVALYGELSLRLFKGLSFDLSGSYSMIHDQLSLPKRGVTQEEILLQRRELATQYYYWGSFGLSYTFGSIYSNVVNPRFGN